MLKRFFIIPPYWLDANSAGGGSSNNEAANTDGGQGDPATEGNAGETSGGENNGSEQPNTLENLADMLAGIKKTVNHDMAARRKELEALQKTVSELVKAIAPENESEDGGEEEPDYAELLKEKDAAVSTLQERYQKTAKILELERAARKMGFANEVDAAKLALALKSDAVKLTDDGKVEGAEEALKHIAETYPAMLKRGKKPQIDASGGDNSNRDKADAAQERIKNMLPPQLTN